MSAHKLLEPDSQLLISHSYSHLHKAGVKPMLGSGCTSIHTAQLGMSIKIRPQFKALSSSQLIFQSNMLLESCKSYWLYCRKAEHMQEVQNIL